jgi:hypothetical protein
MLMGMQGKQKRNTQHQGAEGGVGWGSCEPYGMPLHRTHMGRLVCTCDNRKHAAEH